VQQVERACDRSEEIVEIVGDAPGKLSEGLQLLDLVKLRNRRLMLGGSFFDAPLKVFGEVVELDEAGSRFILATPGTKRRLGDADQGRRVERPFEKGRIAEYLEVAARGWVAL
jgi:hypothetical protein